jgi:hypothetical protein
MQLKNISNGFNKISFAGETAWFSRSAPIAFTHKEELFICENIWDKLTGRHLNRIDTDHSKRLEYSDFMQKFNEHFGE